MSKNITELAVKLASSMLRDTKEKDLEIKTKKIAINVGEGCWCLSPRAMKMLAELRGQKPVFLRINGFGSYEVSPEEIKVPQCWDVHDSFDMSRIDDCINNRDDENLITVIEWLGHWADWEYCKLKIVEIPSNADYKIFKYGDLFNIVEEASFNGMGPETVYYK